MCGIFCLLSPKSEAELLDKYRIFEEIISRRGPNSKNVAISCMDSIDCNIFLAASVLWLRGCDLCSQPLQNDHFAFLYNGDIFGGKISIEDIKLKGDTRLLFEALTNADNVQKVLETIQGPYSFILLDKKQKSLYFGRDIYGRRSLLLGRKNDEIIITSVAKRHSGFDFIELPSVGTFCMDLKTKSLSVFPWRRKNSNFRIKLQEVEQFLDCRIELVGGANIPVLQDFSLPSPDDLKLIESVKNCSGPTETIELLLRNTGWLKNVNKLSELLLEAVRKRIESQPEFCQNCFKNYNCKHCTTGILFSGGVDCTILALLADEYVPKSRPIDLLNVAFGKTGTFHTPDRQTSLESLKELKTLCPEREWNLIEINVAENELNSERNSRIADLIFPLNSVLDEGLGCALWFASRGHTSGYISPCRTLLVGMGADELFGGYTKHRAALKHNSWEGLQSVLERDWENISFRNLARDDRVVSDHGRQLRTPYLDEEVVDFVRSLNTWEKTMPLKGVDEEIGGKILLRTLAWNLGLTSASLLKKRALQFGSRIANRKENGNDISQRLMKTTV